MHLLTLGGTGFLSTAVVTAAVERGHDVLALSRGRTGTTPPGARAVHADRDDEQALRAAVEGLPTAPDAVVDVCGYSVAGARAAASVLGDVSAYAYVSSISAYRDWPPGPVADESAPTFPSTADLEDYGPMKAESERVLSAALPDRVLHARAGLIVGPGDRTRRMTTWLHRFATQERVAVPDDLDRPIAVVDVRDLGGWLVEAVERGLCGPVNATGDRGMTTYGGLLEACRAAVAAEGGTPGEMVVVSEDELVDAGVRPWADLPFWMPAETAATGWHVGTARARELGLPSRPVAETVRDAWRWVLESGFTHPEQPESLRRWEA